MAGVKKSTIKTELAKKFKCNGQEERIAVFGMKLKFGGGRSTGFAYIFDDLDARKKYDTKDNLRRVSARNEPSECNGHREVLYPDCLSAFPLSSSLFAIFLTL